MDRLAVVPSLLAHWNGRGWAASWAFAMRLSEPSSCANRSHRYPQKCIGASAICGRHGPMQAWRSADAGGREAPCYSAWPCLGDGGGAGIHLRVWMPLCTVELTRRRRHVEPLRDMSCVICDREVLIGDDARTAQFHGQVISSSQRHAVHIGFVICVRTHGRRQHAVVSDRQSARQDKQSGLQQLRNDHTTVCSYCKATRNASQEGCEVNRD